VFTFILLRIIVLPFPKVNKVVCVCCIVTIQLYLILSNNGVTMKSWLEVTQGD